MVHTLLQVLELSVIMAIYTEKISIRIQNFKKNLTVIVKMTVQTNKKMCFYFVFLYFHFSIFLVLLNFTVLYKSIGL